MGRITVDQSHQVMATLAINTKWEEIDFEQAQLQELVIRNPKGAGEQFGAFLKNGGRVMVNVRAFQVWKTIKLGTHKDAAALKQAIVENGLQMIDRASDIIGKPAFTLATEETTLDLVNVSVADLGFTKVALLNDVDIYARAIELGLSLCPAEVGPQLRRQYLDQPKGEWLRIAMKAIADSGGDINVFRVGHDEVGRRLGTYWVGPGSVQNPTYRFVFTLRK